jgi:hypothetical protein
MALLNRLLAHAQEGVRDFCNRYQYRFTSHNKLGTLVGKGVLVPRNIRYNIYGHCTVINRTVPVILYILGYYIEFSFVQYDAIQITVTKVPHAKNVPIVSF